MNATHLSPPTRDPTSDRADPAAALWEAARRRRGPASRGPHRLAALLGALGNPHLALPVVHVVGTDGKSSVARLLGAVLAAHGLRTGVTTSPHVDSITERIALGDGPVPPSDLATAVDRVLAATPAVERRIGEPIGFFEVVTAAAALVFAELSLDLAVVEAGIGGSGDATAAMAGRTLVVTPVGLDHPELGATPAEVAREKAGLLAVGGTLVSAPQSPEVEDVLAELVAARGARWDRAGRDHHVEVVREGPSSQRVAVHHLDVAELDVVLPLRGHHQAQNLGTALAAARALLGRDLEGPAVRRAVASLRLPGRVEVHPASDRDPELVLDGAHDPLATAALATWLRAHPVDGPTALLIGASHDRAPDRFLAPLRGVGDTVTVTAAAEPGSLTAAAAADRCGRVDAVTADVPTALARTRSVTGPTGRVVVVGSLYLVAEVRRWLELTAGTTPAWPR
jgi:dihydrofolate synthase / folylpolyglutamate synthase